MISSAAFKGLGVPFLLSLGCAGLIGVQAQARPISSGGTTPPPITTTPTTQPRPSQGTVAQNSGFFLTTTTSSSTVSKPSISLPVVQTTDP